MCACGVCCVRVMCAYACVPRAHMCACGLCRSVCVRACVRACVRVCVCVCKLLVSLLGNVCIFNNCSLSFKIHNMCCLCTVI